MVKPHFAADETRALLKTAEGREFEDRRDNAIMRIFMDDSMRVSGMAGLRYHPDVDDLTDVFLDQRRRLRITLKGKVIFVPIGRKSVQAIDRYLRARALRPQAESPWLWLGMHGRNLDHFTGSGIYAMQRGAASWPCRTPTRTGTGAPWRTGGSRTAATSTT